jgi:type IV fimbrial biogenesis protein FimT
MLSLRLQRGVTLVELMVALVIMGVLLAAATPSFSAWMSSTRIRSTAEGMLAGLQYAKSEATTRNTQVRFQITTSLDASCALSTTSGNWVVDVVDADNTVDSVVGQCNAAPSDTTAPSILQVRSVNETGRGVVISADANQVVFNGLGRQVPVAPAVTPSAVVIDITPAATVGTCAANGGRITCLRVLVTASGLVRMCNPAVAVGDPQAC